MRKPALRPGVVPGIGTIHGFWVSSLKAWLWRGQETEAVFLEKIVGNSPVNAKSENGNLPGNDEDSRSGAETGNRLAHRREATGKIILLHDRMCFGLKRKATLCFHTKPNSCSKRPNRKRRASLAFARFDLRADRNSEAFRIEFWKVKCPKRFGEKKPFLASQFHHFKGLVVIESDGFLHKYMFACVKEPAGAQGHEPQGEIGEAFSVTALHELLQFLPGDRGSVRIVGLGFHGD
jgi:hypothetical protein